MACKNCERIRSAILHGKMAAAASLTLAAFRDKFIPKAEPEPEKPDNPDISTFGIAPIKRPGNK